MSIRQKIRKNIRAKRAILTFAEQRHASLQLISTLKNHQQLKNAHHIGLYLANDGELDPMLLIEYFWSIGKQVYLPVLHPFAKGYLLFIKFTVKTLLVPNRFGIPEPRLCKEHIIPLNELDVVMTPLVAFDLAGNRLGMGGGFYDRTLSQLNGINNEGPYLMGIAHDLQQVSELPCEAWDIPLAEIVTPTRIILS